MNKKMRARKRRQARRVALTLVLMLTVALVSIGGTIAWLTDSTQEVKNTFTVGNIDIELAETTGTSYKMVPGDTFAKDPKVTVKAGSEKCYVFVKITESTNLDSFIDYDIADGWTELETGVYYRVQEATTADVTYSVLANDQVTVLDTVDKADMDALTTAGSDAYPTLTFKAYACQYAKDSTTDFTAAEAWNQVKD